MLRIFCFVASFVFVGCLEKQDSIEIAKHNEKPKRYGYGFCSSHIKNLDTIGYYLCCEEKNACWKVDDSLVRLNFPQTKFGNKGALKCAKTLQALDYWSKHCKPKGIAMLDCPCPIE